MKRQGPFADPRMNLYSHTERMAAAQKLQHEAEVDKHTGKSHFIYSQDERIGRPSNFESHMQMSRDGNQMSNTLPSHPPREDYRRTEGRSYHQGYNPNPNNDFEKQFNREAVQAEQDMEIGYEDTPPHLTFDGLERKFNDEILKLVKEQSDLEDAEITRHKERLMEINIQYQQQLSSLREKQAARRQEFLQKESDTRLYQYQKPGGIQGYPDNLTHQYGGVPASVAAGGAAHQYNHPPEATRTYGASVSQHYSPHVAGEATRDYRPFESYGERSHRGSAKTEDAAGRVPYPEGRVYNTVSRYH
ncbi:unnamed protein product [Rhodiola kirilowii]